jgi:hypothetical protein
MALSFKEQLQKTGIGNYPAEVLANSVAIYSTDPSGNVTGLAGPSNKPVLKASLLKMQRAMTAAKGNNSEELAPWLAAPLWVTGTTYATGEYVRNSAGNLYQLHPAQAATVAGATEPTHVDNSGVYDGGGSSGCLWFYRGKDNGTITSTPLLGNPPATSTQSPTGVLSYITSGDWSCAASTIVAGTGANGAAIGQGLITLGATITGTASPVPIGSPVTGTGVSANTQIIKWNSGAGAGGSVGIVNISQVVASTTLSYAGFLNAGGIGFSAYGTKAPSNASMPLTVTGGPIDTTTDPYILIGPPGGLYAAPTYANGTAPVTVVSFETNARWLAIQPSSAGAIGLARSCRLKIEIDGRLLSVNSVGGNLLANTTPYILIDFTKLPQTTRGYRTVKIYGSAIWSQTVCATYYHAQDDYVGLLKNNNSVKMSFEGDSLTGGGNGTPYDNLCLHWQICANLLGIDNVYSNAVGSTGFISDGAGTKTTYLQRIDRVNLFQPDIHIVVGGHNDSGQTSAARIASCNAYISAFRSSNPNAILVITGSKLLCNETPTTIAAVDTDLQACVTSAQAAGDNLIFFVPTLTDVNAAGANRGWWTFGSGVGKYFYNAGAYTDGHPLPADHEMFAHRLAQAIRSIVAGLY